MLVLYCTYNIYNADDTRIKNDTRIKAKSMMTNASPSLKPVHFSFCTYSSISPAPFAGVDGLSLSFIHLSFLYPQPLAAKATNPFPPN